MPFNTSCQQFLVQANPFLDGSCPNTGSIILMTNEHLRNQHEDGCRILSISGHLYFQPQNAAQPTFFPTIVQQQAMKQYMRIGLRKDQVNTQSGGVAQFYNPLRAGVSQDDLGDFTEGRWRWLREHYWQPGINTQASLGGEKMVWQPSLQSCVGSVEYCVEPESLTDGSGNTWSSGPLAVGHLATKLGGNFVCPPPCDENNAIQGTFVANGMQPWHLPVNIRKPIVMKENDALNLWFGWENLMAPLDTVRQVQTDMLLWGGLRMLIEK